MRTIVCYLMCFLLAGHGKAQQDEGCLPGFTFFTRQGQIDSFQIIYPGCTVIQGSIEITGEDIINLEGLNVVTSIGGALEITGTSLENLSGLDSLVTIGSDLLIAGNNNLTGLTGLNLLSHVGGSVSIGAYGFWSVHGNPLIKNLAGLDYLSLIDGDLTIIGNDSLASLTGLENLVTVNGSMTIEMNSQLINLTGLTNLINLNGDIVILNNNALTGLDGLDSLDPASLNNVTINFNPVLSTCHINGICTYLSDPKGIVHIYGNAPGCNNPPEIAQACGIQLSCLPYGYYYLHTQHDIDSFQTDYSNCEHINGTLQISSFDIQNLNGLYGIKSIGGSLMISGNDSLTDLSGLESLDSIEGQMIVQYNPALTSLHGLDNIEPTSVTELIISGNSILSACEVACICEYLSIPGGYVSIYDNAPGCDSEEEVEGACMTGIEQAGNIHSEVRFYPNPFHEFATIEFPTTEIPENCLLKIFDVFGRLMKTYNVNERKMTISRDGLSSGTYIYILEMNSTLTQTGKILIQ